jgi:hypothetical protein
MDKMAKIVKNGDDELGVFSLTERIASLNFSMYSIKRKDIKRE